MPSDERLWTDDRKNLTDQWEPTIELHKDKAIVIGEPDPAVHVTPQNDQLTLERRILCFKPAFRFEW